MAGRIKQAKIDSKSARERLKTGRQPHWHTIETGKVHLGYQRDKGERTGRWFMRRNLRRRMIKTEDGKEVFRTDYSTITLGLADDVQEADGDLVLSFEQAKAKARAKVATTPSGKPSGALTVRQAMARYFECKRNEGQDTRDTEGRSAAHILPELGSLVVAELTAEQLGRWRTGMAERPPQRRPKQGKPQYGKAAEGDERIRARRASANRVLTVLRAALNHAYDEGLVANRDALGTQTQRLSRRRGCSRALSDHRGSNAPHQCLRSRFLPTGHSGVANRLPLRRANPPGSLRFQWRRRHRCHSPVKIGKSPPCCTDRRRYRLLSFHHGRASRQ
jgi:hypothetical protein